MCTLVVLFRPGHDWPLLVAGNRDELRDRAWRAPARHWPDRPEVVAGLDQLAGGSWFGINDHGLMAAVMNREGTLGPQAGKRSRGELVLEALDHATAADAVKALTELDSNAYRAFNLLVGDPVSAHWLRYRGTNESPNAVETFAIAPGVHMLTASDLDDMSTARIRAHLPGFRKADVPDPVTGEWTQWQALLANRAYAETEGPRAAMNVDFAGKFGTVCSHLLAIPRYPGFAQRPVFLFAGGPPDQQPFVPVALV